MKLGSQTVRVALLGVFATGAAFFLFRGASSPTVRDPIDAVPKESFLVGTLDVEELRRSPIYEVIPGVKGGGAGIGSLASVEEACGFDPIKRIERMALTVPEKEGERDYGVIARVKVTRDELQTCKRRLDEKRGSSAPTEVTERGDFVVIDTPKGKLAYGSGDLLVVSKATWFDTILETANGKHAAVKDSKEHEDLRFALTAREGWRAPTLVITAILPSALRERIKKEMAPEADREEKDAVMGAVLGVSAVGVAMRAGPPGGHFDARILMSCDSQKACELVEKLVLKKRLDWSRNLLFRLGGFGPVIDSIETKVTGSRLEVSATANVDSLAGAIERAIRHAESTPSPPPGMPAIPGTRRPDETLKAPDGG
jgi:hypothetical protein